MYRYLWMPDGLVIKTIIYDWTKLTNEVWSQKLDRMASFGHVYTLESSQEVEEERKHVKDKKRTVNASTSKEKVLEDNKIDVDHFTYLTYTLFKRILLVSLLLYIGSKLHSIVYGFTIHV